MLRVTDDDPVREYERLRGRLRELDAEVDQIDRLLVKLERPLPPGYCYPGDETRMLSATLRQRTTAPR